jgi:hypothetical protein
VPTSTWPAWPSAPPPTSVEDLQAAAATIAASLQISANICEDDCDVSAGITSAIDDKLNP